MKQIDTSTYNFPEIIANDFLYIDKTEFVWKLVAKKKGEYFLSRPRRFGKSLLVSTLKALFQGKRELFRGLAIDKKDYDWSAYPVIHLDFGACMAVNKEELETFLGLRLAECADSHNIDLTGPTPQERFIELIKKLAKDGQVVVLFDEYDKPILNNITNPCVSDILNMLKGFYGVIKTYEALVRFSLITGVSKFAHVSLFSELNNLTDITLNPEYAEMLGFTEREIHQYFSDRIPLAAKANGVSKKALMEKLLEWYDGYRFSKADTHVCNPVSISKFFNGGYDFMNYWDETGTPSFLLKLSVEREYDYQDALDNFYGAEIFSAYEIDKLDITGLLWQTGYLTIKEIRQGSAGIQYRLDFPDREVNQTYMCRLLEMYTNIPKGRTATMVDEFASAICSNDLDGFMKLFKSFLAGISYDLHLRHEKYYQTIFFIVFKLLGLCIEAEAKTNDGRIDAYIRIKKCIYIFEFKLNKSTQRAVRQILDRRYYERFQHSGLHIVLVGVNFNSRKGQIDNWAETTLAEE